MTASLFSEGVMPDMTLPADSLWHELVEAFMATDKGRRAVERVAEAFEVPLAFLMNPAHHRRHRFEWDGNVREWFSMPYVERVRVEPGAGESPPRPESEVEHFIWGATAGMLRNFYRFLSA